VNFSEQPVSTRWTALTHQGKKLAEVWFKPEGEPFVLAFRVPQSSFQNPHVSQLLTLESLLKAVGIAREEVESWRLGSVCHDGQSGANPELKQPLPGPAPGVARLEVYVCIRQPLQVVAPEETPQTKIPSTKEQDTVTRWSAILGLEASIDGLRMAVEGVRAELESAWKKPLSPEERLHALRADVHQWTKAKARVPFTLPKVREFVHRATWVIGTPERKKLGELFKNLLEQNIPLPEMDRLPNELENLLKDLQILSSQGNAVYQECKNVSAEMQGALTRLKNNASTSACRNRNAGRAGGKFLKDVRRWTTGNS